MSRATPTYPRFFSSPSIYAVPTFVSFTDYDVNNAPVPPPVEGTFFPNSAMGPFPENPGVLALSPLADFRGSSIPIPSPIAQCAEQVISSTLFVPRELVKHKDDLLLSFRWASAGYPTFTTFTVLSILDIES